MKSLCIKTNNLELLYYLQNELKYSNIKDICFSLNKFKNYNNIIIHYLGPDIDTNTFVSNISSLLSFLVIDEIEEDFLKKIICQNYFYFDAIEKRAILEMCYSVISEDFFNIFDKKFKILSDCFYAYIFDNKTILLDGFLNFRVKEYIKILEDIVANAVNNFIIEKEYTEFISLLKLYINSHDSKIDVVNLVYSSSNSILLDNDKNKIDIKNDVFNAKFLSDISFSSNDLALNSLLTLLPKKIYIHIIDGFIDDFISTLQLVFEKRVELCLDCNICRIYKKNSLISKNQKS